MVGKESEIPKISAANTKKEMLEAYQQLKKRMEEKARVELKPEKVQKARKEKELTTAADTQEPGGVAQRVNTLKQEIGNALAEIAAKLEQETATYNQVKAAIAVKQQELEELFEIERSAFALAALLETQKQKKLEFEREMDRRKTELDANIAGTRAQWEKDKREYQEFRKESKKEDDKVRNREREEYEYSFNREQAQKKRKLQDDIDNLKKELAVKQEAFDKEVAEKENDLLQRDLAVSEREKKMDDLQAQVSDLSKEMESRVNGAVEQTTASLKAEAQKNEELLTKGFEGEKNVLLTKIESLEQVVGVQNKQLATLNQQIEKAYGKVQDIAVKAVASSQKPTMIMAGQKSAPTDAEK